MGDLTNKILNKDKMRLYVIEKVKKPLRLALVAIAKRYPEPTKENCTHPNTQILFDLWEKFKEHDRTSPARAAMFDAVFKIFICEYEHDPYYRSRFDWCLEFIKKTNWKKDPLGRPVIGWAGKRERP